MRQLRKSIEKFQNDVHGATAVLFAFCVMVLLGCIGLAVDYALAYRAKSSLTSYADAAALAASAAARDYIMSNNGFSRSAKQQARQLGKKTARKYFKDNATGDLSGATPKSVKIKFEGRSIKSTVSFLRDQKTVIGSLFGVSEIRLEGTSVALADLPKYTDVNLLIDTSGSMALGAGPNEQARLKSSLGCAFACHDGNRVKGYPDAYAYATGNRIMLRYDAVNEGINELMNVIDDAPGHASFVRTGLYSFDNQLHTNSDLTNSTSVIRQRLPKAPATSGEVEGATHFNEIIGDFVRKVGRGGDGSKASQPIKLVIIATDGVQDPGRMWTSQVALRQYVAPFDMKFCDTLKDNNVRVGIIHTPYLAMDYDWGYRETLGKPSQIGGPGTRADDVPILLKKCAGKLYVKADDAKSIKNAFSKIFENLTNVRLTN